MLSDEYSVLLIDDDADVLDAYTLLLEQEGYHVFACSNPFDARNWLQADWPGIVLSDVCMPGCNGIDLMTLFHQDDNQLPILCQRKAEVSPSVRNRDVMLWFRECV